MKRGRGRPKGSYTPDGRQRRVDVLNAIQEITRDQKYPPTAAQIARTIDLSFSGVQYNLRVLRQQGYVSYVDGGIGRTLKRTGKDPSLERLR